VIVRAVGDDTVEGDEYFNVVLLVAINAILPATTGELFSRVVIVDDDTSSTTDEPSIAVEDTSALEGDAATFAVSLSSASTNDVTVRYFSEAGTVPGTMGNIR
jgi:hypothetical protein